MKVEVRKAGPMEAVDGSICLHCDKVPQGRDWARRCRAEWLRQRMSQGLDLFVAQVKGRTVGFVEGEPMSVAGWDVQDLYWLHCIYVDDGFRNKRIGEQLLHTMEADAAHRSRGLYAKARIGWLDLSRLLGKLKYESCNVDGELLFGKMFRGKPEPLHRKPVPPPTNRPLPDEQTVLVEHYWHASCAMEAYDSYILQGICRGLGNRVRLHTVCQDEPMMVQKFGGAPGYVFVDGAEPANLYKAGAEDPDAVRQFVWSALRAKRLI